MFSASNVSLFLDYGCGTGARTIPLLEEGMQVISIDQSTEMLNILKEKANNKAYSMNLSVIIGDCERLPFKEGFSMQ